MNDIERCQTWISDKTLAKLAWALHVEIHELFVQNAEQKAPPSREAVYLLFKNHRKELHDYIDRSFNTLLHEVAAF